MPAPGGAYHSIGHQQSPLRRAQRHHGGEEKRKRCDLARLPGRRRRACPAHRAHLRPAEDQEDGVPHRHAERSCGKARRKTQVRSAGPVIMKILVVTEQRQAKWNKASFETLAAAQQIAADTKGALAAAVVGKGVAALADELAGKKLDEVLLVEHDLLDAYTADGFTQALAQVIAPAKPDLVLFPHTYQVRDFAPQLAASLHRGMIGDCVGYRCENGRLVFVRLFFFNNTATTEIYTLSLHDSLLL